DDVGLDRPVHVRCAGMIEDKPVILPGGGTKAAADNLAVEPEALRRARQHYALHLGLVPALGQHADVHEDLDGTPLELLLDPVALQQGRIAVEVAGDYT